MGRMGLWVLGSVLTAGGCTTPPCSGSDRECAVSQGRYFAFPPTSASKDGPWPVAFHLHGGGGSAETFIYNETLIERFTSRGYLLIIPEAIGGTWRLRPFAVLDAGGRDDLIYFDTVIDDVETKWPIDRSRMIVSGFSIGGSMTWELACNRSDTFAAFAPLAGGFWEPLPTSCPGPAAPLMHSHGTADTTVPLEGRDFGVVAQGDIYAGWEVWKSRSQCGNEPTPLEDDPVSCDLWADCSSGADLRFCLHDGAHVPPAGWVERELDWFEAL